MLPEKQRHRRDSNHRSPDEGDRMWVAVGLILVVLIAILFLLGVVGEEAGLGTV